MKKNLDINVGDVITSYSYYAYPQCIMTAKSRVGNKISEFVILDTLKDNWSTRGNIRKNEKGLWEVISEDFYLRECNGCIYRELEQEDFVSISVNYQQYTQAWAAVNLFITDREEDILTGDNEYLCRFGNFICEGISLCVRGEWRNIAKKKVKPPYQLVLSRKGDQIEVYAGEKRAVRCALENISFSLHKKLFVGVQVKHMDNSYYPWFYSNFIQLSCDVNDSDRRLEYHYGLSKYWDCNIYHYFLDINNYSIDEFCELGGLKFLKKCINQEKYVELKVDQYYISERDEYHAFHHWHQCLVFGYDDHVKALSLVGYNRNGKLICTKIRYSDFLHSIKSDASGTVKVMRYSEDRYWYLFQETYVKRMIQEYVEGINSSEPFQNVTPRTKRIYGLQIYDELASKKGIQVLIADRRIAHVLWEHKRCMEQRIAYMTEQNIFSVVMGKYLMEQMCKIKKKVFDLKNILLKYQICPEKTDSFLIQRYLVEIRDSEKRCLEQMLDQWQG